MPTAISRPHLPLGRAALPPPILPGRAVFKSHPTLYRELKPLSTAFVFPVVGQSAPKAKVSPVKVEEIITKPKKAASTLSMHSSKSKKTPSQLHIPPLSNLGKAPKDTVPRDGNSNGATNNAKRLEVLEKELESTKASTRLAVDELNLLRERQQKILQSLRPEERRELMQLLRAEESAEKEVADLREDGLLAQEIAADETEGKPELVHQWLLQVAEKMEDKEKRENAEKEAKR